MPRYFNFILFRVVFTRFGCARLFLVIHHGPTDLRTYGPTDVAKAIALDGGATIRKVKDKIARIERFDT